MRPHYHDSTISRPICEVKHGQVWLVLACKKRSLRSTSRQLFFLPTTSQPGGVGAEDKTAMTDGEKPPTQGKEGGNVPSKTFEGYETVDMSFTRGRAHYVPIVDGTHVVRWYSSGFVPSCFEMSTPIYAARGETPWTPRYSHWHLQKVSADNGRSWHGSQSHCSW